MTITSETFKIQYTSTGASTPYPYTFKILESTDLSVYLGGVLQVEGTNYSVTDVGEPSGGNVVFSIPPSTGATVLITRDGVQFTQQTHYIENDSFPAAAHEDALDKQTMLLQRMWDYVKRCFKVPITSTLTDLEMPEPECNKLLAWDSAASVLRNVSLADIGAVVVGTTGASLAASNSSSEALNYLNVSPFMKTVLDDTDATAARSTLQIPAGAVGATGAGQWTPNVTGNCVLTSQSQFTKVGGSSAWDSHVYSTEGFVNGAFLSFKPGQTNKYALISLQHSPPFSVVTNDYGFMLVDDGHIWVWEAGWILDCGLYTTSTVASILYDGVNINYYIDGVLKKQTARALGTALCFDCAIHGSGASINSVVFGPAGQTFQIGSTGASLVASNSASEALTILNVSAFGRTIIDDTDATAARATLQISSGGGGVTSVTASAPLYSSGGATPNLTTDVDANQNYIIGGGGGSWGGGPGYNVGIGYVVFHQLVSGQNNFALGYSSNYSLIGGNGNVGIGGGGTLYSNQYGYYNIGIGYASGWGITGNYNTAISAYSLFYLRYGDHNTGIGLGAGQGAGIYDVSYNVLIGNYSGFNLAGNGNVFIGYQSGYNETGSNKLYIANSNTATPLIYGEFDTPLLKVNGYFYLPTIKSGATQAAAGAAANEVWKTSGHASLPDNVLMIGV